MALPNYTCDYKLYTKYENQIQKAFDLIKDKVILTHKDIIEYGKIGENRKDLSSFVVGFFHLINYAVYVRTQIDKYVENCIDGCLTVEQLNAILNKHDYKCILESNVCNQYTNNILNIFFSGVKTCDTVCVYEWSNYLCKEINEESFLEAKNLLKICGDEVESFLIPTDITVEDLALSFGISLIEATTLLSKRIVPDVEELCCIEDKPSEFIINVLNRTTTSITIDFVSDVYPVIVKLYEGLTVDGEIIFEESINESDLPLTFNGLTIDTDYLIEITCNNCAGTTIVQKQVKTLPIRVILRPCDLLSNVTFTGLNIGENIISSFGENILLSFDSLTPPYANIIIFTINGVDVLPDINWTHVLGTANFGGNIEINNIVNDLEIFICGNIYNICNQVFVNFDELSNTISITSI